MHWTLSTTVIVALIPPPPSPGLPPLQALPRPHAPDVVSWLSQAAAAAGPVSPAAYWQIVKWPLGQTFGPGWISPQWVAHP